MDLLHCKDLNKVSHLIGRDRRFAGPMKTLRTIRGHQEHLVLSAPATLALAIKSSGIVWPSDRPLRVLLLNPLWRESLDRSQWFRFVPAILGLTNEISVICCNGDPQNNKVSVAAKCLYNADRVSTRFVRSRASEFLKDTREQPDIAISFSEFERGEALLNDLIELAEHGIPLYFTSFSTTHALLKHAILKAHGAVADLVVETSPFAVVSKRAGENWNRVLSRVEPAKLPFPGTEIDQDYAATLDVVQTMVLNSHKIADPSQSWPIGTPIDGGWIHTLDGISVNKDTCEVFDATTQETIGCLSPQWHEFVHAYEEGMDGTDRLIWAAYIRNFAFQDGLRSSSDLSVSSQ